MIRRFLVLAMATSLVIGAPMGARASWLLGATGSGYGKARSMPQGNTPSASVTGRNVDVSWTKSTMPGGADVQDYRVRRYDSASGTVQAISSACDVYVATLSCTESNVPAGTWRYTVAPRKGNWIGAESTVSSMVTVNAPSMSFTSPTTITSLEAVLSGTVSNFRSGSSLTFRLDNVSTGTVLTSTTNPNTIPSNGSATFNVTIPKGTSAGSHTVYATDGQGESASASMNVNIAAPTPTSLTTVNAGGVGGTGRIERGDSFSVVFSQAMDVSAMCSTWSGDSTNQSINTDSAVGVRINNNASLLGNDTLTIVTAAGTCGGSFNFGTIDLGSIGFVTADATFGGTATNRTTIAWTAATRTLTVTVGGLAIGTAPARLNIPLTATYTPHASLRNSSWIPISGTASRVGVLF